MAEKWVITAVGYVEDENESSHGVNGIFDTLEEAWEASKASAFEDLRDAQTAEIDNWKEEDRPEPFVTCLQVVEADNLEATRQYFEGTHKNSYGGHKARQVCTHELREIANGNWPSQWIGRFYVNRVDFAGPGSVL